MPKSATTNWWTTKLSRRAFGRLSAGAVGLASALAIPSVRAVAGSQSEQTPDGSGVEQNRLKRAGVGLRAYDPDGAFNGFTLFNPPGNRTVLIDMEGNVVHTWTLPYAAAAYGYLTDRGTLFYNGNVPNPDFPGRIAQAGVALEADWDGNILWEVRNPDHAQDGLRLRNGNVLLLCYRPLPPEIAAQVQGGFPGTEQRWGMDGDYLQEVTIDGQVVWEWQAWDYLDPVDDGIAWPMDNRSVWSQANGIAEWPNGDIMVSFRNASRVITISRQTGEVLWKLGSPPISGQHHPTPLPNGNILVFDNGPHRFDSSFPYSRALEIAVPSMEIVWRYQDNPVSWLFSPRTGSARRLPNGNTLIDEGYFGRFVEVTEDGTVVWEYVNPFFGGPANAPFNQVFRAYRYSADEIDRARATGR